LILLWFLAAWGMYLLGKKIWNESMAGFLSSLVYIFSPYYVQDIYIRGAYAEFAAFSFFPWIIYLM
jgi:uncharacterized membrane protein